MLVRDGQFSGERHFKESHLKPLLHFDVSGELIRIRRYENISRLNGICKLITHFPIVDRLLHIFNAVAVLY